jgi:hypothetical protein
VTSRPWASSEESSASWISSRKRVLNRPAFFTRGKESEKV